MNKVFDIFIIFFFQCALTTCRKSSRPLAVAAFSGRPLAVARLSLYRLDPDDRGPRLRFKLMAGKEEGWMSSIRHTRVEKATFIPHIPPARTDWRTAHAPELGLLCGLKLNHATILNKW